MWDSNRCSPSCTLQTRTPFLVNHSTTKGDVYKRQGFGTYRFDHRGHGRSEGERTYYDDFNQLLDDVNVVVAMAVSENSALPVFLLGHSMGAVSYTHLDVYKRQGLSWPFENTPV